MNFDTLFTLLTTSTTSSCDENGGIYLSSNDLSSTLTMSATTTTLNDGMLLEAHADSARTYISSMSEEQIDTLLAEIDQQQLVLETHEGGKVKTIGTLNKF